MSSMWKSSDGHIAHPSKVCFDVISNPRITTCAHACEFMEAFTLIDASVCLECITEVLRRSSQCPLDRRQLPPGSLIELPPDEVVGDSADREVDPKPAASIQSAKITELVKLLHMFAPTDKSLVFSQFTKFLDHVGTALDAAGISYCRFDGSMPATVVRYVAISLWSMLRSDDNLSGEKPFPDFRRP